MMNVLKKYNKVMKVLISIAFVFLAFGYISNVKAASLSVSASSTTLTVGSVASITITGNDAIGGVSISSSNPSVLSVSSASEWVEGSVTIRATAVSAGSASISVSAYDMANSNGDAVSPSGAVTITVNQIVSQETTNNNTSGNTKNNTIKNNTTKSNNTVVDPRSSNANLASLTIEGVEFDKTFSSDVTNYSATVENSVNSLKVSAIPQDTQKATTVVSGNEDLQVGENTITITVKAENGTKKVYTIIIHKLKNPDDENVKIKTLSLKNAVLKGEFSTDVFEYMLDDISCDISKLEFEIETEIEGATYSFEGNDELKDGINHVKLIVKSKDGSKTQEYEFIVYRNSEKISPEVNVEPEVKSNTIVDVLKKNWLLILTYSVIILEFIVILVLCARKSSKPNKKSNNTSSDYNIDISDIVKNEVNDSLNNLPSDKVSLDVKENDNLKNEEEKDDDMQSEYDKLLKEKNEEQEKKEEAFKLQIPHKEESENIKENLKVDLKEDDNKKDEEKLKIENNIKAKLDLDFLLNHDKKD